nr:hypothetical protein [Bacteroidota bacterium]
MRISLFISLIVVLFFGFHANMMAQPSQNTSPQITVSGVVKDISNGRIITNLMLINLRTRQGLFAGATGDFNINVLKNDTFIISAPGYNNRKLCFADSTYRSEFKVEIFLERFTVQLKEIEVFAPRDLEQIEKDIEKLGYQKSDYVESGLDAISSPITFLYQQFSRRERAKRDIAEKRNDDRRRDLLKELLAKYVANDIIQLPNAQFDTFIDFCNVNDEFLKGSSQYEFIMFVKKKYEFYKYVQGR